MQSRLPKGKPARQHKEGGYETQRQDGQKNKKGVKGGGGGGTSSVLHVAQAVSYGYVLAGIPWEGMPNRDPG